MKILLFAGTSEGRQLSEYLSYHNFDFSVCVATDYAKEYLSNNIDVITGRKNFNEIKELISSRGYSLVLDATHPYADVVTENIKKATDTLKVKYLRVLRDTQPLDDICIEFQDVYQVVDYLNSNDGNILLTTGTKNLKDFVSVKNYQERIFARILDNSQSYQDGKAFGYKNIILNTGACDLNTNLSHIEKSKAKYLVTKESGITGGFIEKIQACKIKQVIPIVISRPKDVNGLSLKDVINYLDNIKNISIIGVGMGNLEDLSKKVVEKIQNSDVLIGAERMLNMFPNKNKYVSYNPNDIAKYINDISLKNIVILMSGDTGFFSGTKKLLSLIDSNNVTIYSGISSVSYLSSKIGISWNDSKILSIHGRECNYISAIDKNKKVFLLTGGNIKQVCNSLIYYNLDVDIIIGENLSQQNERISYGKPIDFINKEFSTLSIMYIGNPNAKDITNIGICDDDFIRGNIPMTKSEVRAISISKCNIEDNFICWDIGAGTGSVSIEMAKLCENGKVYAVEKNHEGVELIKKNSQKFRVSNIEIIEGNAKDIVNTLPTPNVIFIGGSGGKMFDILDIGRIKNPNVRVVINCVTLETLNQVLDYLKLNNIQNYDITQIAITRTNKISSYNMLKAENPIFVISMQYD